MMATNKAQIASRWIVGFAVAATMFMFFAVRPSAGAEVGAEVGVYKSPTCGCCEGWVAHMKRSGFTVKPHDVSDVARIKTSNGVPSRLWSCHTSLVGGYVIEGHVPAADIQRLLRERPEIMGLAVPGMVAGSPGMAGVSKDGYQVLSFDKNGNTAVYANH